MYIKYVPKKCTTVNFIMQWNTYLHDKIDSVIKWNNK